MDAICLEDTSHVASSQTREATQTRGDSTQTETQLRVSTPIGCLPLVNLIIQECLPHEKAQVPVFSALILAEDDFRDPCTSLQQQVFKLPCSCCEQGQAQQACGKP